MPIKRNRFWLFLFLHALTVWLLACPPAPAQEVPPQDVVFLVDASENTGPLLPAITGILRKFVGGCALGDSFTCYQFSNNPVLIAKVKVQRRSDIEILQAQLLQLHGGEIYTNYSPAVEKGLTEILQSFHQHPAHDRLLVLITDGRYPEDLWSEKLSLSAVLRTFSEISAGANYSFLCFYVGDAVESDLQAFLHAAGARLVYWPKDKQWLEQVTLADVRVVELEKALPAVPETPAHSIFTLSFFPRRPPSRLTMIELDLEENLTAKTLDRLFDPRPRRFVCRQAPWAETFTLETRGFQKGNYSGRFLLSPSEPQFLILYPSSVPFRFSTSKALRVVVPRPLQFGPTGSREPFVERKDIYIQSEGSLPENLDAIEVKADISVPDGLQVNISPISRDQDILVQVTLSRDEDAATPAEGMYEGVIRFSSPGGWTFTQDEVPVSVSVREKPLNIRRLAWYAALSAGAGALVILLLLSFSGVRRALADYLAHRARPTGKLIPIKDPTRGLAKTLNLYHLSEKGKAKSVLIGTGDEVDIEISHISMVDKEFLITGLKVGDTVNSFIEAIKGPEQVFINGIPRVGTVPLKHLDRVKMGAFEFRYEESLLLQQVVLYYLTGEAQQGWLLEWNTAADGFRILKREEKAQPTEIYVRFDELKAVAFVRDFEGDLTPNLFSLNARRKGHMMRAVFADQEELTGYAFDWRNPGEKFYFFPDSMGDNVLFLLIERHTLKDLVLLKEDSAGAKQAQKGFERILHKMSRKFRMKA